MWHTSYIRLGHKIGLLLLLISLIHFSPAFAIVNKLSGVMPADGDVVSQAVSPDGQYAVFTADKNADDVYELYSTSLISSSTPTLLNGLLPVGHIIAGYAISPDSTRVVYLTGLINAGTYELYSVPITGPAPGIKINGALVANGGVANQSWQISPDSTYVIYIADQEVDEMFEIYSVPITGPDTANVKLNSSLISEGDVQTDFRISPDNSRVVYRADQEMDFQNELYSAPIDGSVAATKLNKPLVSGGSVGSFLYQVYISSDSAHVVYMATQDTFAMGELYSVPLAGPAASGVKLNVPLAATGDVVFAALSPDGNQVVYIADPAVDEAYELYSSPISQSGSSIKLADSLVFGGSPLISSDSLYVVYPASSNLYSVPIDGSRLAVKLNGSLVINGSVNGYQISPDGSRVVYRADQQIDNVYELYSVPIDGPAGAGVKISGPLTAGGSVDFFYRLSPDNSRVIYMADQQVDEVIELYSTPLTGPAGAGTKISGPLVSGGDVTLGLDITVGGTQVMYRADQDVDEVFELYATDEGYIASTIYVPLIQR